MPPELTPAIAKATGAATGVVVSYVESNGPAAGVLRVGDVVTFLGEQPVADTDAFATLAAGVHAGATLALSVVRDGVQTTVEVATATAQVESTPTLGLTMRSLPPVGAEVVIVTPGSAAARAGLRSGDVITHLNGEEHPTPRAIERAWAERARRAPILGLRRGSQPLVVAFP